MSSNKEVRSCRECSISKPISEFHKDGIYRSHRCKICFKKYKKDNFYKNKKWLDDYKNQSSCSVCSYSKESNKSFSTKALEFHHVKGKKLFAVSNGLYGGRSQSSLQKEIDKCIIVCSRCHAEIHTSI